MPGTSALVDAIKAELRVAGITYAKLAADIGVAESSVKRMLSRGELTLARIDDICRAMGIEFDELSERVVQSRPQKRELTLEQERAVIADRRLLLMAICCLSQWTFEQIVETYRYTPAEATRYLVRLDRLGVIRLKPMNRYRLNVAKTFRWQPHGPVMRFFRETAAPEYFGGHFAGDGEMLSLVHGQLSPAQAAAFNERLERVAHDFAQQHLSDQRLAREQRDGYTLVLGMRTWLYSGFREWLRERPPSS